MPRNRVAVLGAGPAGLWTALTLLENTPGLDVTVLEAEGAPGGLTASFSHNGLVFDHGSHRLHPATRPDILDRIRDMIGWTPKTSLEQTLAMVVEYEKGRLG